MKKAALRAKLKAADDAQYAAVMRLQRVYEEWMAYKARRSSALRRLVLPSTATTVPGSSAGINPDTHRRKLDSTARASSIPKTRPMVSCEAMPCSSFISCLNQSSRSSAQA